jgi:predicted RNA-binding Zn ribbon-like protein
LHDGTDCTHGGWSQGAVAEPMRLANRKRHRHVKSWRQMNTKSGDSIVGPGLALCLEFANTLAGRGAVAVERLHDQNDLIGWCLTSHLLSEREAAERLSWSRRNPGQAAAVFADAITLREAIYRIFANLAMGVKADSEDLNQLNRVLLEAPARSMVASGSSGFGWSIDRNRKTAAELLAPVAWSAGDLLTGKHLGRVRLCANQQCLWLFLDDSLGGARRWCSMQACGNRAKTRRHYLRRKANEAAS